MEGFMNVHLTLRAKYFEKQTVDQKKNPVTKVDMQIGHFLIYIFIFKDKINEVWSIHMLYQMDFSYFYLIILFVHFYLFLSFEIYLYLTNNSVYL